MSSDRNLSTGVTRRDALELLGGLAVVMAMQPENPVVGGTVLRRAAIQSPNFVTGSTGWQVKQDGSAEFNNVVIRGGQIVSGSALFYSTTPPAANKMIASVSANGGTDAYGNVYIQGVFNYVNNGAFYQATGIQNGAIQFYSAPSEAGPWTPLNEIVVSGTHDMLLQSTFGVLALSGTQISVGAILNANFGAAVTGGLTADTAAVNGSDGTHPLVTITNAVSDTTAILSILAAVANSQLYVSGRATGDGFARIVLGTDASGRAEIRFGSGAAGTDTFIYRIGAGALASDDLSWDNSGAAETWNAPTFANSWANQGTGTALQYKRAAAPNQSVALVGRLTAPAGIVNGQAVITALPANYQPAHQQDIAAWDNTAVKPLRFQMGANGVLTYQAGGAVAGDSIDIYPCLYYLDA